MILRSNSAVGACSRLSPGWLSAYRDTYFTDTLPDGDYPGDSTVNSGTETLCAPFARFIGTLKEIKG